MTRYLPALLALLLFTSCDSFLFFQLFVRAQCVIYRIKSLVLGHEHFFLLLVFSSEVLYLTGQIRYGLVQFGDAYVAFSQRFL